MVPKHCVFVALCSPAFPVVSPLAVAPSFQFPIDRVGQRASGASPARLDTQTSGRLEVVHTERGHCPMRNVFCALACLFSILLAACPAGPKKPTAEDIYQASSQAFEQAKRLLADGEIVDSWQAYRRIGSALAEYAAVGLGGATQDLSKLNQPAQGRPLREWEERWSEEYREQVQNSWPAIEQAVLDGRLDVSLAKGFVHEFGGPDMQRELSERVAGWARAFRGRAAGQYFFECDDRHQLCGAVFAELQKKLPAGALSRSLWADRSEYRGLIAVHMEEPKTLQYIEGRQVLRNLPAELRISVSVRRRAGDDIRQDFTVSHSPPERIFPSELERVTEEHFDDLKRQIGERLASLAPLE